MNSRESYLLSPYRLPTQSALYLADDDVATFLHGYRALWHPAAVIGSAGPPRLASPYEHEQPRTGCIYAVPESPPTLLSDDWDDRARECGAVVFRATTDAAVTLENLRGALRGDGSLTDGARELIDMTDDRVVPFCGVGVGFLCVEALFEAMNHDNQLSVSELWADVVAAASALTGPDPDAPRRHLQAAAERLFAAREIVYPAPVHIVDLFLPQAECPDANWPAALTLGLPLSVIGCAALLERLAKERPDRLAILRERVAANLAEVCGGPYREREDALLPLESQLWNLLRGQAAYRDLLGQEVRFFARQRFGHHPMLPSLLQNVGIGRAALLSFDESVLPAPRTATASWPAPDGKQVDVFCRAPLPADSPKTFFHLTHHLHRTIMQDSSATLALLHRGKPAAAWYGDWLELTRLSPVLGRWSTLSEFLDAVTPGEYLSPENPDEFHGDYLLERTPSTATFPPATSAGKPISWFAEHLRQRRALDAAWTLSAIRRALGDRDGTTEQVLTRLEDDFESDSDATNGIEAELERTATAMAGRLVSRGQPERAGLLVLNPCGFTRRVSLELSDCRPALEGPVKAAQPDGAGSRVVVELPALGFAWLPRSGAEPPPGRVRLAEEHTVRNEFFEAEVDTATGGLKTIRDPKNRFGRLGQQLVFNPGSTMRARGTRITSSGPALGEIVSEGEILDAQDEVIAAFRQRFRAWLGRPVLEIRVEIQPTRLPAGYPWHAYFGARFAWRDERAAVLRSLLSTSYATSYTRPETPDFLEVRESRHTTAIFPGGRPFHQRNGARMLDVILLTEGETATAFELGIALDRDYPGLTAQGLVTPAPVIATDRGPPHVGATGWLFHLDAPNLLLTTLRPIAGSDAVTARLLECGIGAGSARLRCARDPQRAYLIDSNGQTLVDLPVEGDAVLLDFSKNDLVQVRVEFS
jgi:alpha-mannosidase